MLPSYRPRAWPQELDAAGGPTLLPEGQRQAYNAGLAYRARYLNASTCAADGASTCLDATVAKPGAGCWSCLGGSLGQLAGRLHSACPHTLQGSACAPPHV